MNYNRSWWGCITNSTWYLGRDLPTNLCHFKWGGSRSTILGCPYFTQFHSSLSCEILTDTNSWMQRELLEWEYFFPPTQFTGHCPVLWLKKIISFWSFSSASLGPRPTYFEAPEICQGSKGGLIVKLGKSMGTDGSKSSMENLDSQSEIMVLQ